MDARKMISRAEAEALRSAGPPYQVRVLVTQVPLLIETVIALYDRVEELQATLACRDEIPPTSELGRPG